MTVATAAVGAPPAVTARGVWRTVGRTHLLRDIDLEVPSGTFTAIVGGSGAGKSTLLAVLAGMAAPSAGQVLRAPGTRTALVPQDDLVHGELPLRRSLLHAAALRVPGRAPDRHAAAVDEVLARLGLTDRADIRVADLSGGQRKRASVAAELLGAPDLLLLDEPTSGLDPLRAEEVTSVLRRLVDAGMTVVATTHDRAHLVGADHVVALAPGGRLAYAGPPDAAAATLGLDRVEDLYGALERQGPATPAEPPPASTRPAGAPVARRAGGRARQWWALTRRSVEVTTASRLTSSILAGSPALVVAMMVVLFPRHVAGDDGHLGPLAFWMAFCAFFFGLTGGLLQVVTERAIVRRELFVGVRPWAYLAAKAATLLPVLAASDLVLLGALRATGRLPALGPRATAALAATLLLTSAAALALGLLASAAVRDTAQATLALPMLCFPQVLFAGGVVPIDDMTVAGRAVSTLLVNRWAFGALARSIAGSSVPAGHWAGLVVLGLACAAGAALLVGDLSRAR